MICCAKGPPKGLRASEALIVDERDSMSVDGIADIGSSISTPLPHAISAMQEIFTYLALNHRDRARDSGLTNSHLPSIVITLSELGGN